jgi:hypothetical protein
VNELILQFSSTTAWQSGLIRRVCHSPFSHVDIVVKGEGLLGASDPGGVKIRPFDYEKFSIRRRAYIHTDKADKIISRAKTQIGKPFDSAALHAFLDAGEKHMPRDWRDPDQWFCAELVLWALEKELFFPYKIIVNEDCVSPPDLLLMLNPYINVEEFWLDPARE